MKRGIAPMLAMFAVLPLIGPVGCHHRSAAVADAYDSGLNLGNGVPASADQRLGVELGAPDSGLAARATRIEDLFSGRFSGLYVQRSGTAISLRFRGAEPLVVVDGIRADPSILLSIHPRSVLRIELLKDAVATAVYGNRGLNGVVVITTHIGH